MEINKQLFEDVLSGKLKGMFVLRDGTKIPSCKLESYSEILYFLAGNIVYCNGRYSRYTETFLDIVDFIPDTNMETKELKIEIPEGFEIDKENSSFEKIVFKKKDKPRSWEEYCHNFTGELFFENNNDIDSVVIYNGMSYIAKSYLPSKELVEAFLAMMQLMSLRQAWIGDWKPEWNNDETAKWCIRYVSDQLAIDFFYAALRPLSFPTEEMAKDFMNTFKDLLEIAKPLV